MDRIRTGNQANQWEVRSIIESVEPVDKINRGFSPTSRLIAFILLGIALRAQPGGAGSQVRPQVRLSEALLEDWRWTAFGRTEGLPSLDITQIIEAEDGTVWVSTPEGPAWYDGFQWRSPEGRASCLQGLKNRGPSQIQAFGEDRILALWDGRLFVISQKACRESVLKRDNKTLILNSIGARFGSQKSGWKTLIEDRQYNVFVWDGVANELGEIWLKGGDAVGTRIRRGPGKSYFAVTSNGVMRAVDGSFHVAIPANRLKIPTQITGATLRAITENHSGEGLLSMSFPQEWVGIWEWGKNGPLHQVKGSASQIARVLAIAPNSDAIAIYNSQQVWVRGQGKWAPISPVPSPLRNATESFFDSQNRLWVASANGLHLLRTNQNRWLKLSFPFPDLKNHLVSLLPAKDGRLLIGTADGLITFGANGAREDRRQIGNQPLGLVTGLVQSDDGDIWLSSGANFTGAYRLSQSGNSVGTPKRYGPAEGLPDVNFHQLHVDPGGTLWALATGGGKAKENSGPYVWSGQRFQKWEHSDGLIDSHVYSVARAEDNSLWFATSGGLSRFRNSSWRHWKTKDGLKSDTLFFVTPRPEGGVYFLDRANGVGEIDANDTVRYHQIGPAHSSNAAWQLQIDNAGNWWVATRGGLYVRRSGIWNWIGQPAGLENLDLWPLAFWNNHICAGSDGTGLFCLNQQVLGARPPRVEFEAPRVDGSTIEVQWHIRNFEDAASIEGNTCRYRRDAAPWSGWQVQGRAIFQSLSPGKHLLEVEAKGPFGSISTKPELLEFSVPAPFFAQPLFLVPVGISIAAAFVAIFAFVSRKVVHNRELAEKEERFRALLEYSSIGITLRDRNQRVFYVSPAISTILGYEPEELMGPLRQELLHPDDVDDAAVRTRSIVEVPGQTLRSRVRMKHKNGEYRWVEVTARNLLQNSAVGAIVTNFRDITDATQAEIAASEARIRAEHANQAKSDFLAMISHEIRTPMNGITGMSHLLLESPLNAEQQDFAETISQSAQSLLALINDVLDFSRIEAGKLSIERAPIHMKSLVSEVAQLMRIRAEQKHLLLTTHYPADAPCGFYGDALRIRQILINLVGNGVKFTNEGEIRIEVSVQYTQDSQYIVSIGVCDSGIGITAEQLPLIFEKFTQADLSTTRRYGGSGLGLTISRSLTELMGGTISATSEPGKGSTFTLALPMDVAPESSLEPRDTPRQPLRPLSEPLDVLLVEDNIVNQKLAVRLLERFGCTVDVAASGIEALAQLAERDYGLVLMDCQMPEMDGYEATRQIRSRERGSKRVPIVALTANAMESDLERCISCGMDSYLTKPIDFVKLRDALEKWGIDSRGPRATSDRDAT